MTHHAQNRRQSDRHPERPRLVRTGLNQNLHRVGASYGVIKYNRSGRDDPHWSDNGACP